MIQMLRDTYALIQKLTKTELKLKSKLWLTKGITTSIKKKSIIYKKKLSKLKTQLKEKNILYNDFKDYANLVTTLSRLSKVKHYDHDLTDHKCSFCGL